jgi:hypothetical protein
MILSREQGGTLYVHIYICTHIYIVAGHAVCGLNSMNYFSHDGASVVTPRHFFYKTNMQEFLSFYSSSPPSLLLWFFFVFFFATPTTILPTERHTKHGVPRVGFYVLKHFLETEQANNGMVLRASLPACMIQYCCIQRACTYE